MGEPTESCSNYPGPPQSPSVRRSLIKSTLALMMMAVVIAAYGHTEGQWFNSFLIKMGGHTDFHKMLMVSTSAILGTILFLIWGTISDNRRSRYGRRMPILVFGMLSTAIFVYLFGVSTSFIWLLICDGVLISITSNMFHVTYRALIPDLIPREKRGKVNSYLTIGTFMGSALIWGLALVLLPKGGGGYVRDQYSNIFLLCSLLLIIGAGAAIVYIREPEPQQPPGKWTEDFKNMFKPREMVRHKEFLKIFTATLFVVMGVNAYKPWMLELLQVFRFSDVEKYIGVAIIVASSALTIILGGRLTDRIGRKKVVMTSLVIIPLGCMLITFSQYQFWIALVGADIVLSFTMALFIALNSWTQDLLPEESRGRFLGIVNVGQAAGQVPGISMGAVFSESLGILSIFIPSAIFLILSMPLFQRIPETLTGIDSADSRGIIKA